MNISQSAYRAILREYDEKQLRAAARAKERRAKIEEELPRLKEIEKECAALHVKSVSSKLKGTPVDTAERLERLYDEKRALLSGSGYSEDDLLPVYECPLCRDTGFTEEGLCRCFKAKITEVLYDSSNIKEILKRENFGTFSFEYYSDEPASKRSSLSEKDLAKRAYNTAKNFAANFEGTSENLLISGGCGTGKTFLSNCIAKEIIEQGYFVVYLSAARLFEILSDSAFNRGSSSSGPAGHIYECDLLIIDDLGTELSNSFTSAALFECINERLSGRKHTIISTNLSAKQLKETYSERIFSRITNRYTMIKLLGSDIRVKKRLEN